MSQGFRGKKDTYALLEKSFISSLVTWIVDRRYRKAVELTQWLDNLLVSSSESELFTKALAEIRTVDNDDVQVIEILKWVKSNIQYVPDQKIWDVPDYWQTAHETLSLKTGDCEDGAILIYLLARFKGVAANKLAIMAGNVFSPNAPKQIGGHAWCVYRPSFAPLNFAYLDWCYDANTKAMNVRNLFYANLKKTWEYLFHQNNYISVKTSNYKSIWFIFNEKQANDKVDYDFKEVK